MFVLLAFYSCLGLFKLKTSMRARKEQDGPSSLIEHLLRPVLHSFPYEDLDTFIDGAIITQNLL